MKARKEFPSVTQAEKNEELKKSFLERVSLDQFCDDNSTSPGDTECAEQGDTSRATTVESTTASTSTSSSVISGEQAGRLHFKCIKGCAISAGG